MPKKLSTNEFDTILDSIINNLINGNSTDALDQFKTLNTLQAGYASVIISESESISVPNKRWLMNAMYNG